MPNAGWVRAGPCRLCAAGRARAYSSNPPSLPDTPLASYVSTISTGAIHMQSRNVRRDAIVYVHRHWFVAAREQVHQELMNGSAMLSDIQD
jgi:hypothetical protein